LINNMKIVRTKSYDFIVTVDDAACVRMVYLDDLSKQPLKFSNVYPDKQDNSTWSLDGFRGDRSSKIPP
jgi:hypothetical protein